MSALCTKSRGGETVQLVFAVLLCILRRIPDMLRITQHDSAISFQYEVFGNTFFQYYIYSYYCEIVLQFFSHYSFLKLWSIFYNLPLATTTTCLRDGNYETISYNYFAGLLKKICNDWPTKIVTRMKMRKFRVLKKTCSLSQGAFF
jgi:hypothetical protein